jgi:uncharacterized membrane protein
MRIALFFLLPGLFVWLTSGGLPAVVASHFALGGAANGFMPRAAYIVFMVTVTVLVPALIALSGRVIEALPVARINLPNRDHWLAPERRAETLATLSARSVAFAALLAVFLCFVHWLVLQANRLQPPRLDESSFIVGLVLFALATAVWLTLLFMRFRRPR